ncbi:hypothetical protein BCR42DRAFT_407996 [Absidia repens]|uniref:Anaphase-promoting complex subunit 4-like WD40 domain-containing protein n=1 Tax=Absidia repens TaxID=90262 RepID=A0A1X2ISY1_9FUNG|nr:hypothetical protein BCR42DRAFT_407996 [Absidia repens]
MEFTYSHLYKHSLYQCQISPDNKYVANTVDSTVVIRDHSQDMVIMHVYETNHPVDWMCWSPDAQYIATMNHKRSVANVWSINDTNKKITLSDRRFGLAQAWWSPDSSSLLISSDLDLKITVWMFIKNEIKYIYQPKIRDIGCVSSPDGKYIAVVEKKDSKDYLIILNAKSFSLLQRFLLGTTDVVKVQWSPDSQFCAVIDNCIYYKIMVYRLDGQLEYSYSAYEYGLGIKSISWHNKMMAIGSYDGNIRLINTINWHLVSTLPHPNVIRSNELKSLTVYEEYQLPNMTKPTLDTKVGYRVISKRPLQLPVLRPDYNKHDPSIGISECDFCIDGTLLATKNDAMPTTLWIWDVHKLKVCIIISQLNPVRYVKWNPKYAHVLVMVCGDENAYILCQKPSLQRQQQHSSSIDWAQSLKIIPITVPTSKFSARHIEWSQDGETLLLLDHHLYCLASLYFLH